jgi:hypothetical protein
MAGSFNSGALIYTDEGGAVFSVSAFLTLNGLPDDPRLRAIIIEETREIWPEIRILEELN